MPRFTPALIAAISVCCAFTFIAPAAAQPGHPKNAATWYAKASEHLNRLTYEQQYPIFTWDWSQGPPSPEVRAALARAAPAMAAFQQAAALERADFGLDFSHGIELLAPHLTQNRQVARLLNADAWMRLYDGDSAGAAQRLASIYRSSAHFGDDTLLISALVGQAVFRMGDQSVQGAMDRAALGPGEAAILLRETERLAAMADPFNYIGAAFGEHELITGWVARQRGEEDGEARLNELFGDYDAHSEQQPHPASAQIMAMSDEEFDFAVDQYGAMTERAVEILSMKDAEEARAAMAEFTEAIREGEYGPLSTLSMSWERILDRKLDGLETLENRIESLRLIALGEVEPLELANAAVWYLRAFEMVGKFSPEALDLLRTFSTAREFDHDPDGKGEPVAGHAGQSRNRHSRAGGNPEGRAPIAIANPASHARPLDARLRGHDEENAIALAGRALEPLLLLSQDVVDVLREASNIRRCDFSIVNFVRGAIAPPYAGGMRDALRLMHADALRHMRVRDASTAADRLATSYRMIAHFAGDPHFVCSVLSHRAFLEAHELLTAVVEDDHLVEDDRGILFTSLRAIGPGDAFGYMESRRRTLDIVRRSAERFDRLAEDAAKEALERSPHLAPAVALAEGAAPVPSNVEIVARADDDELLYYLALFASFYRPEWEMLDEEAMEQALDEERAKWAALHDVLDLDALMATFIESPQTLGERWRSRSRGALHGLEVRNLSALADRRSRARADVRATAALLRAFAPPSEEEKHGAGE